MLFIFDMGGVVTNTFEMNSLYERLKMDSKEFMMLCKNGRRDIWNLLETGKIEVNEFWNEFNERIKDRDIEPVKNDLFRMYFHPVLNIETVKIIRALRKKHRVVCGTNTIQSHWENHLERGDYALFDQTYASNKIGEAKPDPAFFKVILEAENCNAEDAFFTDDRIENINAAESVGLNSVQFINAKLLKKEWKKFF